MKTTLQQGQNKTAIEHMARNVMLDITADGSVFTRSRTEKLTAGALPFFSVDTPAEAQQLITRLCRRARDRSGTYRFNDFKHGDEREIERAAAEFRDAYAKLKGQS